MKRLDHSMIFVLIAGTYTPVVPLALNGFAGENGPDRAVGRRAGRRILKRRGSTCPKRLFAGGYVALGLVIAAIFGARPAAIGWLGVAGLALGGLLYAVGATVDASGRPALAEVFGYDEVFDVLVLVAAALHYAVIAFAALLRAETVRAAARAHPRQRAAPQAGRARGRCGGRGAAG